MEFSNRDLIIWTVIGGAIGGIVGLLMTLLRRKFSALRRSNRSDADVAPPTQADH